ncbi:FUSC family protein [Psychroserpens luteus]|uniref:FUSC family protein n=1 Tax=Psychroserpens luteus TaxID=1434066 RepID=A0ABW5ZNZ6_9FLAO|nr:FUSC family protein [Psychroserpens luteus]
MKKIFLILGFITSILALILAVTPLFKIAFIPAIAALVFGVLTLVLSKDKQQNKKSIQLVFLITIIALALTTYKTVFTKSEVGNTEQMEQKEEQIEEESIEDLEDIEIDDIDIE